MVHFATSSWIVRITFGFHMDIKGLAMVDVQNFLSTPVSMPILEQFFEYICDNEGSGESSYGRELEFFERNDFDLLIANYLYWEFPYWISRAGSPLAVQRPNGGFYESKWIDGSYDRDESYDQNGRDRAFCYGVALQLRNFFRDRFSRPLLSNQEIANFRFGGPIWLNSDKILPVRYPCYTVSDSETRMAFEYACKHYPEFVRYHLGLKRLARQQGYNSDAVDGRGLITAYIFDSLRAVVPNIGQYRWYDVDSYFGRLVMNSDL